MDKASTSSLRLARALVQSVSAGSRPASSRFLSFSPSSVSSQFTSAAAAARQQSTARCFSSSAFRKADVSPPNGENQQTESKSQTAAPPKASSGNLMDGLADLLPPSQSRASDVGAVLSGGASKSAPSSASALTGLDDLDVMKKHVDQSSGEYHFAVWAHKHNTHICVTKPNNDVIMSISCGHLGFRSAQRSSYDAAYQLGAYVCDKLYQNNWHKTIQRMRVSLRGFGPGREAVTKILLGMEGRALRPTITKVSDLTRLKFGGTRSPNPRRLG